MHVKNPGELGSSPGHCHRFRLGGQKLRLTNLHHSVPRDNRCCGTIAAPIEPVVQACPKDVLLLAVLEGKAGKASRSDIGAVITAEIDKEVLDLDPPIIEEGILDAYTDGIPDPCVIAVVCSEEGRHAANIADDRIRPIVVAAAESDAGGAVNEETIEGHAGATAYRAEEVRRAAVTDEAERVVIVVAADQGLTVAFDA